MATSSRNNGNGRRRTGAGGSVRFESVPGGLSGSQRKRPRATAASEPIHWEKEAKKLSSSLPKDAPVYDSRGVKAGSNRRSKGTVRASSRDANARDSRRRAGASSQGARPSRTSSPAKARENRVLAFISGHTRMVLVLIAIIAVGTLVYPAARDYYISTQTLEKATIELADVQNRNEDIQRDIDYLSTDEGKEDYVRAQYGWVKAGENAVIVKGIPTEPESDPVGETAEAESEEPEPSWLNKILDVVFFVGD